MNVGNVLYENLEKKLFEILKGAGDILCSFRGKHLEKQQKESGFLTEADVASERYLIEKLTVLFSADIWAEESGQSHLQANGYQWVIDPLDGTTNFTYGLPYFCISVALTRSHQPILAAIYNPLSKDFFYAQEGKGALCNGKKITVSKTEALTDAIISFGLPYAPDTRARVMNVVLNASKTVQAVRSFGAVALDLAYVAMGGLDGIFLSNLAWWDVAAGMLLVTEAGGVISDFEGKVLTPAYQTCVAGNSAIYSSLRDLTHTRSPI